MERVIKLSRRASKNLENILNYLETEWSPKVKREFIGKLDSGLKHLVQFPESHPKSDTKKGLQRFVLTKQTTIYYKFNSKSIFVVTLFDTRQDPGKLKLETK